MENKGPPFLMGSFLYTTNEKFSEGMLNFWPAVESCGHVARGLESGGLIALRR